MELTQLKYFQIAAKYEHFTKAAAELHITQPTLSKAITTLESELGLQLFDRDGKNIRLNIYGKSLYEFATRIFLECDEFLQHLSDMNDPSKGQITISFAFADNDPSVFIQCFREFMKTYPEIRLFKYQQNLEDIVASLQDRSIDFGIAMFPVYAPGIEWIPLFHDHIGIQVSADSPLAEKSSVALKDIRSYKFLSMNSTPDLMDIVKIVCSRAGFEPDIVYNGNNPLFTSELVSRGQGIALITESRYRRITQAPSGPVDAWSNRYKYVPLSDEFCSVDVGIFYRQGHYISAAASTFLQYIQNYLHMTDTV